MNYPRLYRTLKHLKYSQLFYQFVFRLQSKLAWQKPVSDGELTNASCLWSSDLELPQPSGSDACQSWEGLSFKFVGLEHTFGEQIDWDTAVHGKLWAYNLHYFEYLWGLEAEQARSITLDWIENHSFSLNAEGWEPYPLSLRIMNWVGYWGTRGRSILESDEAFKSKFWQSLALQADWLTKRLEKHLLGNHYLENGAALWLVGSFADVAEAREWKSIGQSILEEQLEEQLMADGMHFERSPMYHNRIVYLLSWLSKIDPTQFESSYTATLAAAAKLQHPDKRIALFNDSALGIYPEVVVETEELGCFELPDAGYFGSRSESGTYIICDAGRIGPDYIPGHAHCDIGSFELSLSGRRLITDAGVYHYLNSEKRHASRSTMSHNTFGPQGVEQAEIWSAFRVGARPNVELLSWDPESDGSFGLALKHDGYKQVGGAASRYIDYSSAANGLIIYDKYEGAVDRKWEGRLHFAEGVELVHQDANVLRVQLEDVEAELEFKGVSETVVGRSHYFPKFNESTDRMCISYIADGSGEVSVHIKWNL